MFRSVILRAHARIYPMSGLTERRFRAGRVSSGQRKQAESAGMDIERREQQELRRNRPGLPSANNLFLRRLGTAWERGLHRAGGVLQTVCFRYA